MTEAGGERTDPGPLSSGTGSRSESDRRKSVEDAAERYLDKLQRGDDTGAEPADAADPEIARALARRLRVIERLHRAGQALSTHGASATRRRLRCPHCGHLLTLPTDEGAPSASGSSVGAAARDVVCPSCGSSFHVSEEPSPRRALEDLPRAVGRFTVKQLLGRGAFGNVYKALDEELDRSVAVKVPRAGYFGAKEDEERFLREARSAARLRHPGIVAVHEIGNDRGVPYIVSEFVESRTLAELIAESRPGFRESAALTASIAEALDFAHAQGVVHRDIKPGNLLIDRAGQPHISDFGLARRGDEDVTVTIDGQILGTPAYMSPEQALGDTAKVGPRSDQYSLGVVLYELLTGERPFRGSKSMLLEQVIRDEPRTSAAAQRSHPAGPRDHLPQSSRQGPRRSLCIRARIRRRSAPPPARRAHRGARRLPARARGAMVAAQSFDGESLLRARGAARRGGRHHERPRSPPSARARRRAGSAVAP
jgi:tRNA A-37 threonylcarbamoyl transferase component Bud32